MDQMRRKGLWMRWAGSANWLEMANGLCGLSARANHANLGCAVGCGVVLDVVDGECRGREKYESEQSEWAGSGDAVHGRRIRLGAPPFLSCRRLSSARSHPLGRFTTVHKPKRKRV